MDGGITQVGGSDDLKPKKPKKGRTKWTNMLAEEGVKQAELDAVTKLANYQEGTKIGQVDLSAERAAVSAEVREAMEIEKSEHLMNQLERTNAEPISLRNRADIIAAKKAAEEMLVHESLGITISYDELEYEDGEEPTVDEIIKEKKYTTKLAYDLFHLLCTRKEEDPKLRSFIERIARHPYDATMLWVNRHQPFMSPELIHSMIDIGSKVDYEIVYRGNKPVRERVFVYIVTESGAAGPSSKIGEGKLNAIHNAYYAREVEQVLRNALDKDFKPDSDAFEQGGDPELVYHLEKRIARYLKEAIDNHLDDQSIRNVLYPILVGDNSFLMSRKVNKDGKSVNLKDVIIEADKEGGPELAIRRAAESLIGVVKGLGFLDRQGIINTDIKPQNVIDTEYGGCLIDFGGFYKKEDVEYFVSKAEKGLFQRNSYCNMVLLLAEAKGDLKAGSSHRFSLAKNIESIFYRIFRWDTKTIKKEEFNVPTEPTMQLDESTFNTPERAPFWELYQLYKKLHQSFRHPYRFFGNDFKNGLDHDYMSDEEVIEALEKIANQQK